MAEEASDKQAELDQRIRSAQVEARARNISHNVRCLECGHQSIEESQADIAIKLRKVIRDELWSGKSDKEIYEKLTQDYGETILYSPKFDAQTAVLWLLPVTTVGVIAGYTLYKGRKKPADVGTMTRALFNGLPLSEKERRVLTAIVKPPNASQNQTQSQTGLTSLRRLFRLR